MVARHEIQFPMRIRNAHRRLHPCRPRRGDQYPTDRHPPPRAFPPGTATVTVRVVVRKRRSPVIRVKFIADVRDGSNSEVRMLNREVGFPFKNGHRQTVCPFRARLGHGHPRNSRRRKAAQTRLFNSDDRGSGAHHCWLRLPTIGHVPNERPTLVSLRRVHFAGIQFSRAPGRIAGKLLQRLE